MKLLIVFLTTIVVTSIMESNGYTLISQVIAAGCIGAFLGLVDSAAKNGDKT